MKKILTLIVICACMTGHAQINVGSNSIAKMNIAGKLSEDYMNDLKKTTTLFTLQYKDYNILREYEKAISAVWKITPFKIIKPEEIEDYSVKEGYSLFTFGGYYRNTSSGSSLLHITYDLWIPEISKKGKVKTSDYYSRIYIYPDSKVFAQAMKIYSGNFSEKMLTFLYNEAVFYNWNAGFLQGYLKTVNDLLSERETRGNFTSDENGDILQGLKKDTLYIPNYVNIAFHPWQGGKETIDDEQDENDIAGAYPYPVKYITTNELDLMILTRTDPFYYLVYVLSASDKYVNVYRSDKGMIYARYKAVSYNFKNKDLSKIANQIK